RTTEPTVYLTFDDGPNPEATPQLLDVLARHGVSATFFVIDKHLTPGTAPILRRALVEGHAEAGNGGGTRGGGELALARADVQATCLRGDSPPGGCRTDGATDGTPGVSRLSSARRQSQHPDAQGRG